MKIVIFTFDKTSNERLENIQDLVSQLGPETEVFMGSSSTSKNLISLCSLYKNEDILMIEDDVELSQSFLEDIKKIIDKNTDKIINFHYNFNLREQSYKEGNVDIFEVKGSKYAFNQCVYLPKRVLSEILNNKHLFKTYFAYTRDNRHAFVMARIFELCNETFLATRPLLVKTKDFESVL